MRQKRKMSVLSEDEKGLLRLIAKADVNCDFVKFFVSKNTSVVRKHLDYVHDSHCNTKRDVVKIIYDRHGIFGHFTVVYTRGAVVEVQEYTITNNELYEMLPYINRIVMSKQYSEIKKGF